jgi:hypothetical protein
VTLSITPSDPDAAIADAIRVTFDADDWDLPQTITVSGVSDNVAAGPRQSTITLRVDAGSDAAFVGLSDQVVNVTTLDSTTGGGDGLEITSFVINNPHAELGLVNVTFIVTNTGAASSTATEVTFGHTTINAASAPSAAIPSLLPGQVFELTMDVALDRAALFASASAQDSFTAEPNVTSVETQTLSILLGDNDPLTAQFVYFPYDINANGIVETQDFFFIANRFGLEVSRDAADADARNDAKADINGNGFVETTDFFAYANRFGLCINTAIVTDSQFGGVCAANRAGGEPLPTADINSHQILLVPASTLMSVSALSAEQPSQVDAMLVVDATPMSSTSTPSTVVGNSCPASPVAPANPVVGVQSHINWQLADSHGDALIDVVSEDDDDELGTDSDALNSVVDDLASFLF